MRKTSRAITPAILLVLAGCHTVRQRIEAPTLNTTWLDLTAGWRLRVIAPVLEDPAEPYSLKVTPGANPFDLSVTATPNLKGFETQYYSLKGKRTAVRIRFEQASQTINGRTTAEAVPLKNYLPLPRTALKVRLIFLARSTDAPHDMAVLYASDGDILQALTERVVRNPGECGAPITACLWIPAHVAIRAERLASPRDPHSW